MIFIFHMEEKQLPHLTWHSHASLLIIWVHEREVDISWSHLTLVCVPYAWVNNFFYTWSYTADEFVHLSYVLIRRIICIHCFPKKDKFRKKTICEFLCTCLIHWASSAVTKNTEIVKAKAVFHRIKVRNPSHLQTFLLGTNPWFLLVMVATHQWSGVERSVAEFFFICYTNSGMLSAESASSVNKDSFQWGFQAWDLELETT